MGGSLPPSLVSKIIRPLQLAELQLRILWEELLSVSTTPESSTSLNGLRSSFARVRFGGNHGNGRVTNPVSRLP